MTSLDIEEEYVHSVYSRLATYQKKEHRPGSLRLWPNVTKFLKSQLPGSTVIDVGCGEAKYNNNNCYVIGVDTCSDILIGVKRTPGVDVLLGDAVHLPFRDETADAVLLVSVLHHLSTATRRKQVLQECGRCLRVGGRMLIYVWAFEQPTASFPCQDLLVPWNLHENTINGRLPQIKFHKNSTKEQRIIEASIPITIPSEANYSNNWVNELLTKMQSFKPIFPFLSPSPPRSFIPPASPKFFPNSKKSLLSGIKRWSPMLGRRIASLLVTVEEQLADEMSEKIMQEAITETMATLRDVTFYRFYHVFRRGELESILSSIPYFNIISSQFEHGNWCLTVEKRGVDNKIGI